MCHLIGCNALERDECSSEGRNDARSHHDARRMVPVASAYDQGHGSRTRGVTRVPSVDDGTAASLRAK